MEKKYGIGLFAAAAVLVFGLSFAYYAEYRYAKNEAAREARELEKAAQEKTVSAQGEAVKEELYYLGELNGYVVVYQFDRKTVFEYTNILAADLPQDIQNELKSGKRIDGTEKLYGFLENYSS